MTPVKSALRVVAVFLARGLSSTHPFTFLVRPSIVETFVVGRDVIGAASVQPGYDACERCLASSCQAERCGAARPCSERHATRPGLRRLFLSGLWATIPVLVIATPLDAGRYLDGIHAVWIPFVIASWTRGDSLGSSVQQLTLVAVVMGSVLLTLATLLNLSVVEEVLLRVCGLGSSWSQPLVSWHLSRLKFRTRLSDPERDGISQSSA